jgi:histidinol-phosphate phosphatase family protein
VEDPDYVVVIPTIGRPSLQVCLDSLAAAEGPPPRQVVLADDRRGTPDPLPVTVPAGLAGRVLVVTVGGRGPAAARNAGWRAAERAQWVVFCDDDVRAGPAWAKELAADLASASPDTAGVQGAIEVPGPAGRPPTDSERATLGLAGAAWITADMAYRRDALVDAGGFDERFGRAFREDSDLALRVTAAGWVLRQGHRLTIHPLRPGRRWSSLGAQAGNADDALMRSLHGPGWHRRAGAAIGRRPAHLATAALGIGGLGLLAAGRRRPAAVAGGAWLAATAEFAARRIRPGPRTWAEVTDMAVTSALIPPLAAAHWLAGRWRHRQAGPWPGPPAAVLFDRDGTLVHDVPYNGDPALVRPVEGAAAAVAKLRRAGIAVAVVTNQSGIAQGLITRQQAEAVNRRVEELLGPFGAWLICPHGPAEGCGCRKPAPGMILAAAASLGVAPGACAVIGDTAADVAAGRAAGARAVLVPAPATRRAERDGTPTTATLAAAVDALTRGEVLRAWQGAEPGD